MIDLRSDTVTRPTDAMREAMREAEVGDDVYGEDPTVSALEARAAARLGKEAALFVPSGTQANLVAILSHCGRGDAYIVGETYHSFAHEGGGAAVLGGIQPAPVDVDERGAIPAGSIGRACRPDDDPHYARTRLVALENPTQGRALSVDTIEQLAEEARRYDLATHLDGARIFNAATALDVPARAIAKPVDSVMFSLSKGLGAPVGALLCGPEDVIEEARRWRKVAGGGWRQAGIIAAGGLHALDHHVERLAEDHRHAERLADRLEKLDGIALVGRPETNMVFATLEDRDVGALEEFLAERDVRIHPMDPMRLVTHIDVSAEEVDRAAAAVEAFLDG